MIFFTTDELQLEIDLLNWYRGEAAKRGYVDADVVQSSADDSRVMNVFVRDAAEDILIWANVNDAKLMLDLTDEGVLFTLEKVRADREYLVPVLRAAMRKYIVAYVRFRWMATVKPEWTDGVELDRFRYDIERLIKGVKDYGRIRRRSTNLAGI